MGLLHSSGVNFWVGNLNVVEGLKKMKPGLDTQWMPSTIKLVRKYGIEYPLIGKFRWKIAQPFGFSHGNVFTISTH